MMKPAKAYILRLSLHLDLLPDRGGDIKLVQRVIVHSMLIISSKYIDTALNKQVNMAGIETYLIYRGAMSVTS